MESMLRRGEVEEHEIVIVGAGIGGLATAVALHRKGFEKVAVYEKWDNLRGDGSAIGVFANGWAALDQLGVGHQLRKKAILLHGGEDVFVDQGKHLKFPLPNGESRCLKRGDLVDALAHALPPNTIRFGCNVVALQLDPQTLHPTLHLHDGKAIKAKVVIGSDGSNSTVARFLRLKPTRLFSLCAVRGLTNYPKGHPFSPQLLRLKRYKGDRVTVGSIPIDHKLVYWFVTLPLAWIDGNIPEDPTMIKQTTLKIIKGYPAEAMKMIEESELESLSFTRLRYRSPWEILRADFHRGPVTVEGDAMHVMGPYLGQGGSATLEDAVVLVRNMARFCQQLQLPFPADDDEGEKKNKKAAMMVVKRDNVEKAFGEYVRERRRRVLKLSTQAYLTGVILGTPSRLVKFIAMAVMFILFRDRNAHAYYNCGKL